MTNTTGKADHAKTTDNTLAIERTKAIVALIVQLYSTVQAALALAGVNLLPFTNDQVTLGVSTVIAAALAVYNWWTHGVMTEAGLQGKQVTKAIKLAGSTGNGIDQPGEVVPMSEPIADPDAANVK